ncbi:MAG: PHP domain-containing protein [Spirochaetales bacterium]
MGKKSKQSKKYYVNPPIKKVDKVEIEKLAQEPTPKNVSNSIIKNYVPEYFIPKSIDMHTHTIRSMDGNLPVAKLLRHAVFNNVTDLAITDHNDLFAVKKAMRLIESNSKYQSVNLITGVEITCFSEELGRSVHVLAYDFDINNKELNEKLAYVREQERLAKYSLFIKLEVLLGIKFSPYEIIKASSKADDINWETIATMAVLHSENGEPKPYARTREEFLDKAPKMLNYILKDQKIKDKLMINFDPINLETPTNFHPSLDEVLNLIKNAGGIPVLAHPSNIEHANNKLSVEEFIKLFANKTKDLDIRAGMEVLFGAQIGEEGTYLKLAKKYGLIPSGGSDFHGAYKSLNHRIGTVGNRYHITNLTLLKYIKGGRKEEDIYYPQRSSEYYSKISSKNHSIWHQRNVEIIEKERRETEQTLKNIAEQFRDVPLQIDALEHQNELLYKRKKLIILNEDLGKVVRKYIHTLKECSKDKNYITKNSAAIKLKEIKIESMLDNYNTRLQDLASDNMENVELFKEAMKTSERRYNSIYTKVKQSIATLAKEELLAKKQEKPTPINLELATSGN